MGAIIAVDKPMQPPANMEDRYVVYYKGPFDDTEFAILLNLKEEDEKESLFGDFLWRWRTYLLSQE